MSCPCSTFQYVKFIFSYFLLVLLHFQLTNVVLNTVNRLLRNARAAQQRHQACLFLRWSHLKEFWHEFLFFYLWCFSIKLRMEQSNPIRNTDMHQSILKVVIRFALTSELWLLPQVGESVITTWALTHSLLATFVAATRAWPTERRRSLFLYKQHHHTLLLHTRRQCYDRYMSQTSYLINCILSHARKAWKDFYTSESVHQCFFFGK